MALYLNIEMASGIETESGYLIIGISFMTLKRGHGLVSQMMVVLSHLLRIQIKLQNKVQIWS